jgi:galactonate dehydratase
MIWRFDTNGCRRTIAAAIWKGRPRTRPARPGHLAQPAAVQRGETGAQRPMWPACRVGDGTLGWKEFAVESLVQEFADRHLVATIRSVSRICGSACCQVEHNTGPVMFAAMVGLETTLWDIAGKVTGQPVVNLVGGVLRDKVRVYANGWYNDMRDHPKLRERVQTVVGMGYTAMKFDPFGPGGREINRSELKAAANAVEVVRDAAGPNVDLLVECHGRLSVGTAIEAIKAMQPYQPLFCEEPIPAHNIDSQAWVTQAASAMGARVATGEHTYLGFGFNEMLQKRGTHVVQPDLGYAGGFMETKKIAAMAETHYISVAPHNCDGVGKLMASIHLCANIPNFLILETFADFDVEWRNALVKGGEIKVRDGYYAMPTAPGWGYDIDEDVARAHPGSTKSRMNMFAGEWERLMWN